MHAVTESAAIREISETGAVLWDARALYRLGKALGGKFYLASQCPSLTLMVTDIARRGIERGDNFQGVTAPKIILATLLIGCGIRPDENLKPNLE